ncbi:hypothetical protein [Streptococcus salivarius]
MPSVNAIEEKKNNVENLDFDELERRLSENLGDELDTELEIQLAEFEFIANKKSQIGDFVMLSQVIQNMIWEQFISQIGVQAGEDFIKDNNGLKLDLRDKVHIQTTDNFQKGIIASHNREVNYKERYELWQSNFEKDKFGNVVTHTTRGGNEEATLIKDARKPFDKNRASGSKEKHTDMDHTVSAAEIIRDAEANAHLTRDEQISFANSKYNLNEMDSSLNRSKGDKSMTDWLDIPNANGQKPDEIFDISESDKKGLRKKDNEARVEYEKRKQEGIERSIRTGRKSQKDEALRVGKKAARAIVMNLLADLVKEIIQGFVTWLKSSNKNLRSLTMEIERAVWGFINNLKTRVVDILDTTATVIASSIIGPVVGLIKKAWFFIKQGWKSLKEVKDYINDEKNKKKSLEIMLLEVGKIVIAGFTAGGSVILGEVIEVSLSSIPILSLEIPLFGSLANIIGVFMGAVVVGIIGAFSIYLINKIIAKKQKQSVENEYIDKGNEVLSLQNKIIVRDKSRLYTKKSATKSYIQKRHAEAQVVMEQSLQNISSNNISHKEEFCILDSMLDSLTEK